MSIGKFFPNTDVQIDESVLGIAPRPSEYEPDKLLLFDTDTLSI